VCDRIECHEIHSACHFKNLRSAWHSCKQVVDPSIPTQADAMVDNAALIEAGKAVLELTVIRARSAAAIAVGAEARIHLRFASCLMIIIFVIRCN
jgi:hypothetical protein